MKFARYFTFSPLLIVIALSLLVAVSNYSPGKYLSGWDNVHPEFNLGNYAHQSVFGAWLEHEGTGGPAAQNLASNVFRLPWLYLFSVLPQHVQRYVFVFVMYVLGGVGMYLYLHGHWLPRRKLSAWVAALGAVFYLLNPLTLQQFYIIFEMFAVQFAFLPFALITIHLLYRKRSALHWLLFGVCQVLLTPSAYQPLVFYLGMGFLLWYAIFLSFDYQSWKKSLALPLRILGVMLLLNSYWIVPNLYFTFTHADYVAESRANSIFKYESLWSIRSAGDVASFLTGIHYLFDWQDYNFAERSHEFIFAEWRAHFLQTVPQLLLLLTGMAVLLGLIFTFVREELGLKRIGLFSWYLLMGFFVWIDIFPTRFLIEKFYEIPVFFEVFRNPFTKFNVLLTLVWAILFAQFSTTLMRVIELTTRAIRWQAIFQKTVLAIMFLAILIMMEPAFRGHLVSEKLRVAYPAVYQELFAYLQTLPKDSRVLELPYYSFEGFEYYDWQQLDRANGYQGLGFLFFAGPQAFLLPDFARWTTATDSFYVQLTQVLNSRDAQQLQSLLSQYRVNAVIVDTSKIDAYNSAIRVNYQRMLELAGFSSSWQKDHVAVYSQAGNAEAVFSPENTSMIQADTTRVYRDVAWGNGSHYFSVRDTASKVYPFSTLLREQVAFSQTDDGYLVFESQVPPGNYEVNWSDVWPTVLSTQPILIDYTTGKIRIHFSKIGLRHQTKAVYLPSPHDFEIDEAPVEAITLSLNGEVVTIKPGQKKAIIVNLSQGEFVLSRIDPKLQTETELNRQVVSGQIPTLLQSLLVEDGASVELVVDPVWMQADLTIPTINCEANGRGTTSTQLVGRGAVYTSQNYGVNCAGHRFESVLTNRSYLLRVTGTNQQGRSVKLFINDANASTFTHQLLLPQDHFDQLYVLPQTTKGKGFERLFNWETRSFGTVSRNYLSELAVAPMPLFELASVSLVATNEHPNPIQTGKIISHISFDAAFHFLTLECQTETCVIGLNQSYDPLWFAWSLPAWGLADHAVLDGWMNGWNVPEGRIVIMYVPELVNLLLLVGSISWLSWYAFLTVRRRHEN